MYFLFFLSNLIIEMSALTKPLIMGQNAGSNYLQECPFLFKSELIPHKILDYEKRRCELYNIYNNSRYKYQYICSYDVAKDFEAN